MSINPNSKNQSILYTITFLIVGISAKDRLSPCQIIGHKHDEKAISIYDFICLEKNHTLLKYIGNKDFKLKVKYHLQNYQREFPHYFNHIQINLDKVEKVSNENTAMNFIAHTMKIDELAAENITEYLKDDIHQIKDIANFYREAYQQNLAGCSLSTAALEKRRTNLKRERYQSYRF